MNIGITGKEKLKVSSTKTEELTVNDAMQKFNIDEIALPIGNDDKIHEVNNNFVGSVSVIFKNGVAIQLSLMRSTRTEGYYTPSSRARVFIPGQDANSWAPAGATVKGKERDDGTQPEYSSLFLKKDLLAFIMRYTNLAASKVEYESLPADSQSSSTSEDKSAEAIQ